MSFTVDDFQDLMKLLSDHPEWRAQLRPVVLGEEILAVPSHMDRVEATLDRLSGHVEVLTVRLDRLTEHVDDLTVRLDRLTERVDQLTERMDDLTVRLDRLTERVDDLAVRLDRLTERVDDLTVRLDHLTERVEALTAALQAVAQRMDKMDGRMGNMEGTMLEWKFERNLGNWLREWVRRPRKVFTDDLTKLDDAVAAGQIADVEVSQVAWSDALVRALDLDTQQEVVLSIELSTTVNEDDVERASFRAGILRRAGYDGRSFVAGHGISKQAQQLAGATGTTVVLVRPDP
ncbi:MAG: hypothetical protein U0837_15770 [Dehalococcoidia bacterium]|jgi:uncharacterized protein YoxC